MSSKSICTSCLRALRHSSRQNMQHSRLSTPTSLAIANSTRPLTTSSTHRQPMEVRADESNPTSSSLQKFATRLRASKTLQGTTEPYVAYGSTQALFALCSAPGNYTIPSSSDTPSPYAANASKSVAADGSDLGVPASDAGAFWSQSKHLAPPTFNSWAHITMLHMYLLTVRFRMFPADHAKHWHQNLLDHFFYSAEDKMATLHNMVARSTRNKYLKDLFVQWRGVLAGYDEGLIRGDAVLGAAVWRNLFGAREDVDFEEVAAVVQWIRKSLQQLDNMSDEEVAGGAVTFVDPSRNLAL